MKRPWLESMSTPDYGALVSRHRNYFLTGVTRSADWRESQLTALRTMMKNHAEDFYSAMWADLRKNRVDADSGMGKYHGEWGSRAYTNTRGVLYHSTQIDPGFRYPPYDRQEALRDLVVPS